MINALFKLRPGLFGLLFAAIAISSFATAVSKAPRPAASTGSIAEAKLPSEQPKATAEQAVEPDAEPYTYLQYQIDTDLVNLERLVKNRAAGLLEQGKNESDLNNLLYDLAQEWQATPEQTVQRLAINRALQTLVDGESAPSFDAIVNPTVEDYRNVTAAE
jgi:hypothetical protein